MSLESPFIPEPIYRKYIILDQIFNHILFWGRQIKYAYTVVFGCSGLNSRLPSGWSICSPHFGLHQLPCSGQWNVSPLNEAAWHGPALLLRSSNIWTVYPTVLPFLQPMFWNENKCWTEPSQAQQSWQWLPGPTVRKLASAGGKTDPCCMVAKYLVE